MYIEELELKGCLRLTLSQIDYIKVDLSNPFQIFIGTNGSGKSSLLEQLSPLPAVPSDFSKDGFKRIVITHHKSRYELISSFKGKATHQFLKDGVELNEGHTITVQRNLVEQEFNITDDIFQLMIGKSSFTRMTPTKRRELFTKMSDTDMSYAFSLFKKVATVARDNQGTVKYMKSRISKETDKLMSLEIHEDISKEVDQLQSDLNTLMTERTPIEMGSHQLQSKIDEVLQRIDLLAHDLLSINIPRLNSRIGTESLEEAVELKYAVESDINSKRQLLDHYGSEHQKLVKLIGEHDTSGQVSPDELQRRISEYDRREQELRSKVHQFTFEGAVDAIYIQRQELKSQLTDILSILPDNSTKKYSRSGLEKAEQNIIELTKICNRSRNQITLIEEKIKHIDEAYETNCPQCGYTWKEGVSEKDRASLVTQRIELEKILEEMSGKLSKWVEYRDQIQEYSALYAQYRGIVNNFNGASNLFNYLADEDRIFHNPSQYIPLIQRWIHDLEIAKELWTIYRDRTITLETLKKVQSIMESGVDLSQSQNALTDIENKVESLTYEIKTLQQKLESINFLVDEAKRSESIYEEINSLCQQLSQLQEQTVKTLRTEKIDEVIRVYQQQLATKSTKLREKESVENIIQDLTTNLTDVESQYEINKMLANALSPTDGIIAKQMVAFINCVIDQVNDILSQLYTYPIEVQPCGIDNNDLDFKFPFKAGQLDNQKPRKDVSEGSEGQQEIIDFAFRLIAMLYMEFNDYPLYIDELGRAQDEQHLTNLMNYIKLLIESNRHSQLFMISHIAAGFGIFGKADVLVLSSSNVTVPSKYNEHVVIH